MAAIRARPAPPAGVRLAGSDEWEEFDATQECRAILLGLGNFDIFHTELGGKPFEGLTVRLFDPQTRLWTIYWADSNAVKLDGGKVGSFDGDMGEFFGREMVAGKGRYREIPLG